MSKQSIICKNVLSLLDHTRVGLPHYPGQLPHRRGDPRYGQRPYPRLRDLYRKHDCGRGVKPEKTAGGCTPAVFLFEDALHTVFSVDKVPTCKGYTSSAFSLKLRGIPMMRDSDGVCGLYDLVENRFMESAVSLKWD